ncbi:type VI secretion system tube protein Hcp [Luteolibacter sp.]|uniref:type VI secretion system tube protein Hcp n=1 Tax=Luteolibacter sp. TaxID=1962973 RepID=UPI0032631F78
MKLSGTSWRHSAVIWMIAVSAHGQAAGWLDFNGQIKGESLQTSHVDWIEIEGFQIGGQLHAAQPGKLGFTKRLDRASPPLTSACAKGTHYLKATLDLNFTSQDTTHPAPARIELEDVFVSSIAISSGGDVPSESFDLVFGRIVYTYYYDRFTSVISNYDFRFATGSSGTGTNPDTDSDGLPDAWETTYGFPIGANNAAGDPDGDGLTNLQEYQLGTDPKSGTSFFRAALAPVSGSPGNYQLSWNSVVGKVYVIEWSPDLATPFATLRTVTATATTSTAAIANAGNVGFYRVRPQ